jgi:hypothetical protein
MQSSNASWMTRPSHDKKANVAGAYLQALERFEFYKRIKRENLSRWFDFGNTRPERV